MELVKSAHSVYPLQYQVVWVCKYRRRILNPGVCMYLRKLLRSMPDVTTETIGLDQNHMHRVMVISPKYQISDVIGVLKSRSASPMRKTFAWLGKVCWKETVVWSPGHFISSAGIDEDTIRRSVGYQGRQDSGQFRMEL